MARRHSIGSKTFNKNRKKLKSSSMTYLILAESFKTKNRPDPAVTLFDRLLLRKYERPEILIQSLINIPISAIQIWNLYL